MNIQHIYYMYYHLKAFIEESPICLIILQAFINK